MEIVQQVTAYVIFTGSSIVKKCPTIMCHFTNVFCCIGLHTMMCTKQLVFTTKNLREWGAMSKMSLNCTSLFAGLWLYNGVCVFAHESHIQQTHSHVISGHKYHIFVLSSRSLGGNQYHKVNILNFPHLCTELGRSVDIVPNIVPPMIDTMDLVHHIGVEPICTADGSLVNVDQLQPTGSPFVNM
jgi:hypothetical protein